MRVKMLVAAAAVTIAAAACHGTGEPSLPSTAAGLNQVGIGQEQPLVDHTSILKKLRRQQTIGSTVDPANGDQNPYGLVFVKSRPFGNSLLKQGDLVVCNFNDKANVQGTGTTLEYMPSAAGSKPTRFAQSSSLLGCASLVINSFDEVFAVNSGAKKAVGIDANAKFLQTLTNKLLVEPWGSVYIPSQTGYPPGDGLWVADASSGKIIRINLGTGGRPTYTAVISGFAVNHGEPGSILGPSGLQYNPKSKTLYIVDGVTNTVVAVKNPYFDLNSADDIVVGSNGLSFSGPKAKDARVLYHDGQLNGPISSTLLPNGNLVVGNTLNKNGKNIMVEIASDGTLLAYKNVDKGAAGALFGIVATGYNDNTTKIYFNDDNSNAVRVLEQ